MIYIIVLGFMWLIGGCLATTEVQRLPHDIDTARVFAEEDDWED